jgi:hypothetical protein
VELTGLVPQAKWLTSDADAPRQRDPAFESFHVPHHQTGNDLNGAADHHDDLVGQPLHRVELVVGLNVMRALFTLEDSVAVINCLAVVIIEKILGIQYGMIVTDPI